LGSRQAAAPSVHADNLLRDPPPEHAAAGPPCSAPASTLHRIVARPASLAGRVAVGRDCIHGQSAAAVFLFSRSEIGCVALPFFDVSSSTLLEDEVVAAPSQSAAPTLVVKPSSPVSPPLQAMAPSAAGPRQASTRSQSAPTAVFARTPPPILLKKDAHVLFSCLIYHRHPPLTVLSCCCHRQEAADFVYSHAFVDGSDPCPPPRLRLCPPRPRLLRH